MFLIQKYWQEITQLVNNTSNGVIHWEISFKLILMSSLMTTACVRGLFWKLVPWMVYWPYLLHAQCRNQ
jgi:hypothetical protein